MAKKSAKSEMEQQVEMGEQGYLIDTLPENAKGIIAEVRLYKKYQTGRLNYLRQETEQKQKVLGMIQAAKLKRCEDGVIRFKCEGFVVTVTPHEDVIRISEEGGQS